MSFNTGNVLARSLVSVQVDVDEVQARCNASGFDSGELHDLVITRRGCSIPLQLRPSRWAKIDWVNTATLIYATDADKKVELKLQGLDVRVFGASLEVEIPATAPVTEYKLIVEGRLKDGRHYAAELARTVVVLFNAWCEDDQVHMEKEAERQEYVLNTQGRLYIGDRRGNFWNLALYRPITMRAVLFVCRKLSKLSFEERADPVLVTREMTALMNIQDENGVLYGRWDGDYSEGADPSSWHGSGAILKQFYESGGDPVLYGQCWVFSGLLLTVLRVLGVPSRSVTNFNSAHDTNCNRSIDEYYMKDGEPVDYLSTGNDSIWNFHVWNGAWMKRPDLSPSYDGWQAVDATPQEESPLGGGYRTGPSSVKAVKEGNALNYDTNFVIAEVNADIKRFVIGEDGVPELYSVDTEHVGMTISTKGVGTWRRNDITGLYKYTEGSEKERKALYNGMDKLQEKFDVDFTVLEAEYDFGEDVLFTVKAHNKSEKKSIRGSIRCSAVTYTGRNLGDVDTLLVEEDVYKGKTNMIEMKVDHSVFTKYRRVKVYLKFKVSLVVVGTSQLFARTVSLTATPPKLHVTGPAKIGLGQKATLLFSFQNPLPIALSDVVLNVDVDGMKGDDVVRNVGTIGPKGTMKYPLDVTGVKLGGYSIVAGLCCDQVELVSGEHEMEVLESVPPAIIELDVLEVVSVDLHKDKNSSAHHTDRFHHSGLVVRRGQPFTISVTTNKNMPKGSRVVTRASFQLVSKRRYRRAASFQLDVVSSTVKGKTARFEFEPPSDTCIGEYVMVLTVDNDGTVEVLEREIQVIILFNPWSAEDTCSYPETSELEEYILNTSGRIWVGSSRSNYGRPWQFSQFNGDCLEVALSLMEKMKTKDRGDPVLVSRHLSAAANNEDDDGVLVGNWSGDYSGGVSPLKWTGSAPILAQYNKTKKPVSFGQCWVFSGIKTSLLRCLGLPARSVTNFNSAHDTNFNRAVDKFYDEDGNPTTTDDSIWNFHVWNEAWMARPDLVKGFGGWQAVDATPQEESPQGGKYRLGPCSVRAVKLGQRMNYDTEFVISEVNADVRYYTEMADGSRVLSGVNTEHVGKQISTKAVGSNRLYDITHNYKFREGSVAERAAMLVETESQKTIGVDIEVGSDITIGDDFTITATVTNKSAAKKRLDVRVMCRAVLYTGSPGQRVKAHADTDSLEKDESNSFKLHVMYRDYLRILADGNFLNVVCLVLDREAKQSVVKTETVRLKTPDVSIDLPKKGLKLHEPADITVSFDNPLRVKLSECQFEIRGDGHIQDVVQDVQPVHALQTVSAVLKTIPVQKGHFQLQVVFSSAELTDVMGDVEVNVV